MAVLLQAGAHPVSNGYLSAGEASAPARDLTLGRCESCGLLQLCSPFSQAELAARVPAWVKYGEPEEHLDDLARIIADLFPGHGGRPLKTATTSYIDQSLAERLKAAGKGTAASLEDMQRPAGDAPASTAVEQVLLGIEGGDLTFSQGPFDLMLARHVLDHVRSLAAFAAVIRAGLSDSGLVVFEVPDSTPYLEAADHLMLWESHAWYFQPQTFPVALAALGFSVVWSRRCAIPGGAVMVAICRKSGALGAAQSSATEPSPVDQEVARPLIDSFERDKAKVRTRMEHLRATSGPLAMIGAGHMGSLFLNIYGLGPLFDCVIDDDPRKAGLRLPGSGLPIVPASQIGLRGIRTAMMAINPASEDKVLTRLQGQWSHLQFTSMARSSPRSIWA